MTPDRPNGGCVEEFFFDVRRATDDDFRRRRLLRLRFFRCRQIGRLRIAYGTPILAENKILIRPRISRTVAT